MAEYIECEAAIKRLHDVYEYEFPTSSGAFDEFATKIVPCALRSIPAADVAPVMHGKWIHESNSDAWVCSRCGRSVNADPEGIDLYCYHCGAKMDEPVEDDKQ